MPTLFFLVPVRKISVGSNASKNTLARVVVSNALPRHTNSSGILHHLHWLPTEQRIKFKLAMLTYNILSSSQPAYLRSLLNYHTPARSLRSSNTNLLSVPRVHTTFASHGFSVAAPTVWNSVPPTIRNISSAHTKYILTYLVGTG